MLIMLAPSIASYQAADARFYYRPAASTIYANEIDLCRECLYMLSGSETLIFSLDSNGTFQVGVVALECCSLHATSDVTILLR